MAERNAPLILLVEDDRDINLANRCALELEGYRVVSATTLALGERLASEMRPDLVLLDVLLPDGNALDAGRRMADAYGCSILYLSCLSDADDVIAGLRSGGDDYLAKPYMMEELLLRVEAVLRRRPHRAGETRERTATGRLAWRQAALAVTLDGEVLPLSPREYAVLTYLRDNADRYVAPAELAREVWLAEDEGRAEGSVHNAVSALRSKLVGSGCAIERVRGLGYRLAASE